MQKENKPEPGKSNKPAPETENKGTPVPTPSVAGQPFSQKLLDWYRRNNCNPPK